ncbi:MAG: phosphotransferase family protein, partial [Acetobacteraceae bacterium]
RGMDQAAQGRLARWLAGALGESVVVRHIERLSGGAIQENWALSLERQDGREEAFVLRRDAGTQISSSRSREAEFRILRAVHRAGITVPEPVALCSDETILGRPFFLMRRIEGTADPRRLVGDDRLVPDRAAFGAALGAKLARIHAIRPPAEELGFLEPPAADPAAARIGALRAALDRLSDPQPAIEWVLRRLERRRPRAALVTLVHGDYRIGNIMVQDGNLAGVLDWEFAGWGDPDEDVGWLCARCWRFCRVDREAGGVAERADFYNGYEARTGRKVDAERIRYWEAMAAVRWAIVALEQGERNRGEEKPGLEAALTGRMAPQLALEAMTNAATLGDA